MDDKLSYVGFYTTTPFWAIEEPDIDKLKTSPLKFNTALGKTAFVYEDKSFKVEISRDGFIMLQIQKLVAKRSKVKESLKKSIEEVVDFNADYLAYINAFQFLLTSDASIGQKLVHFDNTTLSFQDIFKVNKVEGGISYYYPQSGMGKYYNLGRKVSEYSSVDEIHLDERISKRMTVNKNVLDSCVLNFSKILIEKDAYLIFAQLNSSFSECRKMNFTQSLMVAWFCIEYFINKEWIDYLVEKKKEDKQNTRINKARKEALLGKEYTSSIVLNILELSGRIPFDIFNSINTVRSKRNRIVHNIDLVKNLASALKETPTETDNKQVKYIDCLDAFQVLKYFVKAHYSIEIRLANTFTLQQL